METNYTEGDYTDVSSENDVFVDQTAPSGENAIHLYKDNVGAESQCILTVIAKSTLAPSSVAVWLQIYNYDQTTWENLDSDNLTAADTKFTLSGQIEDLTNYKDGGSNIAYRIYQAIP